MSPREAAMSPVRPTVETILAEAVDIASAEARQAFVAEACAGDEPMQREVERLVACHFAAGSFLEPNAIEAPTVLFSSIRESPGAHIGPYKLLEQIGEGGFGVVFMAEQTQPLRRRVALKILKPGMDTRQVIARFEAERQALALMDHSHIAKVLDAGATETGRPYFVMELVKGIPITRFCDEQRLSTRERLNLFIDACSAIQHAHQKGIIHRDIKPSNVLVTLQDGQAIVKVIDFGVAKALGQQLTEKTIFTGFAQMVGTPLYMSPEQAALSNVDVDTRSDVYCLGVLLYELLTGTTPLSKETLSTVGYDELRRIIREEEPPRPSARISTLVAAALSTVSQQRKIDARKLHQEIRGELDWIVMKAIEKERARRYQSATELHEDVQRYLDDKPVQAHPPSIAYRLRKYARRHSVLLTSTVLVAFAVLTGAAVSVWQAIDATAARKLADERRVLADERLVLANQRLASEQQARVEAETERNRADQERQRADGERERAEANFKRALEAVDRMLTRVGTVSLHDVPQMEQVQLKVYEDAVEFYEGFLKERSGDRRVRYEAALAIGRLARSLGLAGVKLSDRKHMYKRAEELLAELHAEEPDNAQVSMDLADMLRMHGWSLPHTAEREACCRRAIELLTPVAHAAAAKDQPGARRRLASSYADLGEVLRRLNRLDESEAALNKCLALYNDPSDDDWRLRIAFTYRQFAELREQQQHLPEAIEAVQYAVNLVRTTRANLRDSRAFREEYSMDCSLCGFMLLRANRPDEGIELCQEAIAIREKLAQDFPMSPHNRSYAMTWRADLARALHRLGRIDAARKFVQAFEPRSAEESAVRVELFSLLGDIPSMVEEFERLLEIEPTNAKARFDLFNLLMWSPIENKSRALEVARKWTELAPDSANAWCSLGIAYQESSGDYPHAADALQKSLTLDARNLDAQERVVEVLVKLGNSRAALSRAEELVQTHPERWRAWYARAILRLDMGEYEHAVADFTRSMQLRPSGDSSFILKRRALAHFKAAHYAEALADLAEAVELKPGDTTNLTWIDPGLVATCRDAAFRDGLLQLAARTLELTNGASDAYSARAAIHLAAGHFEQARSDLQAAQANKPASWLTLYRQALCCLALKDTAGYRATCTMMLDQFGESEVVNELQFTAWTCALAPGAVDDYSAAIAVARRAVARQPGRPAMTKLGALQFRAGQLGDSLETFTDADAAAEDLNTAAEYDWFFLAMVHHHLGNGTEAERWYLRAAASARQALIADLPGDQDVSWNRRLTLELLQAEAAALLGSIGAPASAAMPANVP